MSSALKQSAKSPLVLDFKPRIALVVSHFNQDVMGGLKHGALTWLKEHDIAVHSEDCYDAPGAFEMPLIAQTLAQSGRYDGVICLGCVIKGDTAHFEFISLGTTMGLIQASLTSHVPITFGILTVYTHQQAADRSREDPHNKGREAASACVESLVVLRRIRSVKEASP